MNHMTTKFHRMNRKRFHPILDQIGVDPRDKSERDRNPGVVVVPRAATSTNRASRDKVAAMSTTSRKEVAVSPGKGRENFAPTIPPTYDQLFPTERQRGAGLHERPRGGGGGGSVDVGARGGGGGALDGFVAQSRGGSAAAARISHYDNVARGLTAATSDEYFNADDIFASNPGGTAAAYSMTQKIGSKRKVSTSEEFERKQQRRRSYEDSVRHASRQIMSDEALIQADPSTLGREEYKRRMNLAPRTNSDFDGIRHCQWLDAQMKMRGLAEREKRERDASLTATRLLSATQFPFASPPELLAETNVRNSKDSVRRESRSSFGKYDDYLRSILNEKEGSEKKEVGGFLASTPPPPPPPPPHVFHHSRPAASREGSEASEATTSAIFSPLSDSLSSPPRNPSMAAFGGWFVKSSSDTNVGAGRFGGVFRGGDLVAELSAKTLQTRNRKRLQFPASELSRISEERESQLNSSKSSAGSRCSSTNLSSHAAEKRTAEKGSSSPFFVNQKSISLCGAARPSPTTFSSPSASRHQKQPARGNAAAASTRPSSHEFESFGEAKTVESSESGADIFRNRVFSSSVGGTESFHFRHETPPPEDVDATKWATDETSIAWTTADCGEELNAAVDYGDGRSFYGDASPKMSSSSNRCEGQSPFGNNRPSPEEDHSSPAGVESPEKPPSSVVTSDLDENPLDPPEDFERVVFFDKERTTDQGESQHASDIQGFFLLSQKSPASPVEVNEMQFNMFDDDDDDDDRFCRGVTKGEEERKDEEKYGPLPNDEGAEEIGGVADEAGQIIDDEVVNKELNAMKDVTLNTDSVAYGNDNVENEATNGGSVEVGSVVAGADEEMPEGNATEKNVSAEPEAAESCVSLFADSKTAEDADDSREKGKVDDVSASEIAPHPEGDARRVDIYEKPEDKASTSREKKFPDGNEGLGGGASATWDEKSASELPAENPSETTSRPSYEFLLDFYLRWRGFVPEEVRVSIWDDLEDVPVQKDDDPTVPLSPLDNSYPGFVPPDWLLSSGDVLEQI